MHILWAALSAHIYEALQLLCPICGVQMSIFGFIAYIADSRKILEHIGAGRVVAHHAAAAVG